MSSMEENNFLKKTGKYWWLGLRRDDTHRNIFKWSDGSLPTFTNWSPNEPNNHGGAEDCASYHNYANSQGTWNDFSCLSNAVDVACEKGFYNFI